MRKTMYVIAFLALCGMVIAITSCKKSRMNKETTSESDNATAENLFDDVTSQVDQAAGQESLDGSGKTGPVTVEYTFSSAGDSCPLITVSPVEYTLPKDTFPKTLTLDFGAGCTGNDGKVRKGKIIVTISGRYREAGTTIITTFEDYYINDNKIEGTKTVKNEGKNGSNQTYFTITVDGKVTTSDGKTITWESNRTRTWIEGENTGWASLKPNSNPPPDSVCCMGLSGITDDVYSVSGSATGVNRDGISFTVTITEPLRVQFCGYKVEVTDGIIEIEPNGLRKRTIDFGDGSCDNQATVTIDGKNKTKTIALHG